MGRRNEHSREQIKAMAISAGRELIESKGFSGLSARKVAREIGYTVGTLYNVFDNFTDLICHINAETLDNLRTYLEESLKPGQSGIDALEQLGNSYVEFARQNINLWSALFEFQHPVNDKLPEWYSEKVQTIFELPVRFLAPMFNGDKGMAKFNGEMSRAEYEARIIWGGVHGICLLGLTRRLGHDSEEILKSKVNSLIDNYMKGLEMDRR